MTLPPAWTHASERLRTRSSPSTSVRPTTAASAAVIKPTPNNQSEALAQKSFEFFQNARSERNARTKQAIGKGISMGWTGCPAISAVDLGFGMVTSKNSSTRFPQLMAIVRVPIAVSNAAVQRPGSANIAGVSCQRWGDGTPCQLRQELHRIGGLLRHLVKGTLSRRLVRAPAQDRGAVAKPLAAEMVVADLDHELWLQRTPLRGARRRPAARSARRVAGKAGLCDQGFELMGESQLLLPGDRGAEA